MTTSGSNATGASADIERTRAEIGETVQALAAKIDVKARVQQKAGEVRNRLTDRAGAAGGAPMARRSGAGLVVLATAAAAAWMWRRRRRKRNRSAWHRTAHETRTRTRVMRARTGTQARAARARGRMHARRAVHRVRS